MREQAMILFANDSFYEAFKAGDLSAMEALWARETPIFCAHPGWAPLQGRDEVMESWQAIFEGGGIPQDLRCREPRVVPLGPAHAIVLCYEQVGDALLLATNVFCKEAGHWRLLHHHAGPTQGESGSLGEEPEQKPVQ